MREQDRLDLQNVILAGHGLGGTTTFYTAAQIAPKQLVKAAINFNGQLTPTFNDEHLANKLRESGIPLLLFQVH